MSDKNISDQKALQNVKNTYSGPGASKKKKELPDVPAVSDEEGETAIERLKRSMPSKRQTEYSQRDIKKRRKNNKPKKESTQINELRATQIQSVTGPKAEIDPKTGAAKDCKRWENGKEVPCKPVGKSRGSRIKESNLHGFDKLYMDLLDKIRSE